MGRPAVSESCTCTRRAVGYEREPRCPLHGNLLLITKPCPYCDRMMSERETREQGCCNDCAGDK
jgi:hypothetical protein